MGWAANHILRLVCGETVTFRPRGNSMSGKIESGQLVTVVPMDREPVVGDIVLCKVGGREYLHLVTAARHGQYQISNNKGFINGWVTASKIYGRVIEVV